MLGQGRPNQVGGRTIRLLPAAAHRALRLLCAMLCVVWPLSLRAENVDLRLRIVWGGGEPRPWHGTLRATNGTLVDLSRLGTEPDEQAAVWLAEGEVHVAQRRQRQQSGVDVTVRAPRDAQLLVQLAPSEASPSGPPQVIALQSLVGEATTKPLDDRQNRLTVDRAPSDRLRVRLEQDHLVYGPGETLRLTIEPHELGVSAETRARVQATLREARGGRTWNTWEFERTADAEGRLPAVDFECPTPSLEGAYELALSVTGKRRSRKATFAERLVQFVVVAPQGATPRPALASATFDRVVEEIDPAQASKGKRLGNLAVLPARRKLPLGLGESHLLAHPLGPLVELAPDGGEPKLAWEAYSLRIEDTGKPHVLEVEYPTDLFQTLGICVLEPNAAGVLGPVGVDSGFYVGDDQTTAAPGLGRHRLVFWPRTRAPVALLANRRDGVRAAFGKLRVLRGPDELPAALPDGAANGGRQLWAFYERPLIVENFSASDVVDAANGRTLKDWQSYYEAATRLAEYLRYAGYSGAVVSVAAEGGALYPSALVEPTPRLDGAAWSSQAADPAHKDVLELLCRVFDRQGLQLTAALDLSAPLPALEALRRSGADAGLEWIGPDGAPLVVHEFGPRYNLLHPRVQEAAFAAAHEVIERYARHPSFAGLALQLSGGSFALLPGLEYGMDDATVARFERERGVKLGAAAGSQRFNQRARQLTSQQRKAWESWRTEQVAAWQQELQDELQRAKPTARLLLAGTSALDRGDIQRELLPALPRKVSVEGALRKAGWDVERLAQRPGGIWLRPLRIEPPGPLESKALELLLGQPGALDRAAQSSALPAVLVHRPPQPLSLPAFDSRFPLRGGQTRLLTQAAAAGAEASRPLVHSLTTLDAQLVVDGGVMLSLGQDAAQRDAVRVFRQLPAAAFNSVTPEPQPAAVRTHTDARHTWLYAANDSPWPVTLHLDVAAPAGCTVQSLDGRRAAPSLSGGESTNWQLQLGAYDLWGARFDRPGVRVTHSRATLPDGVAAALRTRVDDLRSRVGALDAAPRLEALVNPGFEQPSAAAGVMPGWRVSPAGSGQLRADAAEKHGGAQAAVLASDGPPVSLLSEEFPAPTTGRLVLLAWLRVSDAADSPALRLALQGELHGQEYYRYAALGRGQEHALRDGWSLYKFRVDDLPLAGLQKLQVRFDLLGAGEVWLDDVELSCLSFTEKEQRELQLLVYSAYEQLDQGRVRDCWQALDGYWPRFLVQHIPLTQPRMARQPEPRAPREAPPAAPELPAKSEAPGVLEGLRTRLNPFKWR